MRRAAISARTLRSAQSMRNWLGLSLAVGVGLLSIVYVFGVNSYAATGYTIQKEQVQLNRQQEENKKLMVKTAEIGSISQIQDEAKIQNLVSVTAEEFLQPNQLMSQR